MFCGSPSPFNPATDSEGPDEIVIEIVDRKRMGPLGAVLLKQRGRELRHAIGGVGQRRVLERKHLAAGAFLDLGFHRASFGDRDRVSRVRENHDAGRSIRVGDRLHRGDLGDLHGVGR